MRYGSPYRYRRSRTGCSGGPLLLFVVSLVLFGTVIRLHPQGLDVIPALLNAAFPVSPNAQGVAPSITTLHAHPPTETRISGPHSILGKPTISPFLIDKVLLAAHSPAAGLGQVFYQAGVSSGIDPVWSLGFFHEESQYGTSGEARKTLSIGNIRCVFDRPCVDQNLGGYAQFSSWTDGITYWFHMMSDGYIHGHITGFACDTLEKIIPIYAPSSQNDVQAYIRNVLQDVMRWRAGQI